MALIRAVHKQRSSDNLPTYYQKHRTIDAFEYDGTLKQLQTEISDLIRRMSNTINSNIYQHPKWQRTSNGYLDNLEDNTQSWPFDHYQMRRVPKQYMMRSRYKQLHVGDYVWITRVYQQAKQPDNILTNGLAIQTNRHKIHWESWIVLQFTNAANFKAHWSSKPKPTWQTAKQERN